MWASGFRGLAHMAKARPARWKWLALEIPASRMRSTRRPFRVRKLRAVGSSCSLMTFGSCHGNVSPSYPSIAASLPVRCLKGLCSARRIATNVEIACGNWRTIRNKAFTICPSVDRRRQRLNQFDTKTGSEGWERRRLHLRHTCRGSCRYLQASLWAIEVRMGYTAIYSARSPIRGQRQTPRECPVMAQGGH